jgi:hypothetical protein
VVFSRFKAEQIAREIERANLPTAVGENLISADRSAYYLVNKLGLLSFAIDFHVARE